LGLSALVVWSAARQDNLKTSMVQSPPIGMSLLLPLLLDDALVIVHCPVDDDAIKTKHINNN
jgi:hypothetical protein